MSARPCRTGDGYDAEGRSDLCAAHRKRAQRNGGDPLAHIPVRRKPTRRPDAVAARLVAGAYDPVTGRTGRLELA